MDRPFRGGVTWLAMALALMSAALWPAPMEAAWLGLRNDTQVPVVVQGLTIVKNVTRKGKPQLLYTNEVSWDCVIQPVAKIIIITDARNPNKVLYRGSVSCKGDLFFSVQRDGVGGVKLVPCKQPMRVPARYGR